MILTGYITGTKGNTGRGIASIVENADYTITINLTDGTSYTTAPIAGFTEIEFDENYDLVVTKTDGTTETVPTDINDFRTVLYGYKQDAETAESNASGYASNASGSASSAQTYSFDSEAWAKGTRNGTAVTSGTDGYEDNSKYYKEQASSSASSAGTSATNASNSALKSEGYAIGKQNGTDVTSGSTYYENNAKYYSQEASTSATNAGTSETNASGSASTASTQALKSEGYAVGKQNGTDVSSGSDYYQNNSKYYSGQASSSATSASTSANGASASALVSEGYALGQQNGTDVSSGSPYYENNAKYYAGEAEDSKDAVIGGIDSLLPTVSLPKADILSFTDGQAVIPAKSLVADIDPIQDLHGYDAPWVGGAGANKWDEEWELGGISNSGALVSANNQIRSKNFCDILPSTAYMLVNNSSYSFKIVEYDESKQGVEYWTVSAGNTKQITTSANTKYFKVSSSDTGITTYGNDWAVNYPSTVTTYSPYENICPISGHTEVNIANSPNGNIFAGEYNTLYKLPQPLPQNTYITASAVAPTGTQVSYYNSAKEELDYWSLLDTDPNDSSRHYRTFKLKQDTYYVEFRNNSATDMQVEVTSAAAFPSPYQTTTYTTQLGQTVYGGTLDVVSGVLTNGWLAKQLTSAETITLVQSGTDTTSFQISYFAPVPILQNNTQISSHFTFDMNADGVNPAKPSTFVIGASRNAWVQVPNSIATTVEDFKTWLDSQTVTIAAKLATPQTYQLTPQQILLLLGENHIFATSGKVAIVYNADVQRYIDNAVGTKEEDMVANNAIPSGSLFSVNDRLYKATSTIAVGETIVVGVNCTETSIIEQLNALITLL